MSQNTFVQNWVNEAMAALVEWRRVSSDEESVDFGKAAIQLFAAWQKGKRMSEDMCPQELLAKLNQEVLCDITQIANEAITSANCAGLRHRLEQWVRENGIVECQKNRGVAGVQLLQELDSLQLILLGVKLKCFAEKIPSFSNFEVEVHEMSEFVTKHVLCFCLTTEEPILYAEDVLLTSKTTPGVMHFGGLEVFTSIVEMGIEYRTRIAPKLLVALFGDKPQSTRRKKKNPECLT